MRTIHRKDKVKGKEPAFDAADNSPAKIDISGWREVHCFAGKLTLSKVGNDKPHVEHGGGFMIRDENHRPQLARGFPMNPAEVVLAQAIALREAVQAAAQLGEDKLVFYSASETLVSLVVKGHLPEQSVELQHNVQMIHFWTNWIPNAAFGHKSARDMRGVKTVAGVAALSAQHLQWDGATIEEMHLDI